MMTPALSTPHWRVFGQGNGKLTDMELVTRYLSCHGSGVPVSRSGDYFAALPSPLTEWGGE
jgi:hypothetical protein